MADLYFPTRADIRQRVRFYIDEPQQANFLDTDINYAINDAQQYVATEIDQVDEKYRVNPTPTQINLVTNKQFYDLNSDVWKLTRVQDLQTGLPINFTDINSQNDLFNNYPPLITGYALGAFSCFVAGGTLANGQSGTSLGFTPIPTDSSKSVLYWYVPIIQDMDADDDVSSIPRQYFDLIAIQAAIDCLIKDQADTAQLERKYGRLIEQLKRTARDRQQQNPKHVTRTGDSQGSGYYI
jgi:hypothetical protein